MKTTQKGFTLIELMIVIAIIAILAAIAVPAYQTYATRSKVSELIVAADACKTSVAEYFQSEGTLPATMADAGCSSNATQYISKLDVAAGVITVTADASGGDHLPADASGDFVLTPTQNGQVLTWTCTASSIKDEYLPAKCRGA